MEINGKNVLVYGGGISGLSAYKFLNKKGANVYIYADKVSEEIKNLNYIKKFEEVENLNLDFAVLSPGVQVLGNKNINKLKRLNINIISEMELGYIFSKGKFIAITGTNGKTTITSLIGHILKECNKEVFVCGNIGVPITSIANNTTHKSIVVCEVSSFMLEVTSNNFKPNISVISNITEDHISRHKTFENYYNTKLKITQNQTANNYLILGEEIKNLKTQATVIGIDYKQKFKSKLLGEFNQNNIRICKAVCNLLNITDKDFKTYLKTFNPVRFRLENLGKRGGITYINDSKSTNPDSTIKALESMKKPCVLLLGGSDKGNDFYDIFKLQNKIKIAIIYGQTANKLEEDALVSGFFKTAKFENLAEALYNLKNYTKKGDIVLFSPACASYDEFSNYIQRGEYFNKIINDN